jgi:hypothetical protein
MAMSGYSRPNDDVLPSSETLVARVGKRGGVRAVYYFQASAGIVYMLDIYAKNEKADLTPADKRELRAIVSMLEESQ